MQNQGVAWREWLWWSLFFVIAIVMQRIFAGLDFLIIAPILMVQEKRLNYLPWVILLLIFCQDGVGSLHFGAGIFWYGAVVGMTLFGRLLFDIKGIPFVCLISLILGLLHFILVYSLTTLQQNPIILRQLIHDSTLQAFAIPFVWSVASFFRERWLKHAC